MIGGGATYQSLPYSTLVNGNKSLTLNFLLTFFKSPQSEFDDNQLDDGQYLQADDFNRGERIALSSTRSRLFIDCTDYEDEAVYTCVAENEYSRISSHTKLNLIRPLPPVAGSENDLLSGTLDDVAALELAAATSGGKMEMPEKSLSAIPQCLSRRGSTIGKCVINGCLLMRHSFSGTTVSTNFYLPKHRAGENIHVDTQHCGGNEE